MKFWFQNKNDTECSTVIVQDRTIPVLELRKAGYVDSKVNPRLFASVWD
jgi:hypothetical protein